MNYPNVCEPLEMSVDSCLTNVAKAKSNLTSIKNKLIDFEKEISDVSVEGLPEQTVKTILKDVSQVKEDYDRIRKDIYELHQLQQEVSNSIRSKTDAVITNLQELRNKVLEQNRPV
uniref:Ska2 N-terminal domain-containing protein n=1 Tax=Clastoptera arizonana TaxID=38151 RepID=A0A1B6DL60_9HEMI